MAGAGLAVSLLWLLALGLAAGAIYQMFQGAPAEAVQLGLLAGGAGLCGLLSLPSAVYAFGRVFERPIPELPFRLSRLHPERWIIMLPVVLAGGWLISRWPRLAVFALPPLHVLAAGIPVAWLLWMATRGLPAGSPQQAWGVFGAGLTLGPALIIVVEGLVMTAVGLIALVWFFTQPDLSRDFLNLTRQVGPSGRVDPNEALRVIRPIFNDPALVFLGLSFGAVLVPLIEEALKPIGVWLLAGRGLTPQEGLVAGALCGGAYALFESLPVIGFGQTWALTIGARSGTGVIHILNTALMGWALAATWRDRRWRRLAGTYLLVVFNHGLWNGLSLSVAVTQLAGSGPIARLFKIPSTIAPYVLIGMAVGELAALIILNRRFNQINRTDYGPASIPDTNLPAPGQDPAGDY
jgi:hypothetical protein